MANFHSMRSKSLPSRGEAGDAYFDTDTRIIYIAVGDGQLVDLASLLSPKHPIAVGPQGEKGERGAKGESGPQGHRGEQGLTGPASTSGRNGIDGARGERGHTGERGLKGELGATGAKGDKGDRGATGPQGPRGDILVVDDAEVQKAVDRLQQQKIRMHAKIRTIALNNKNLPASLRALLEAQLDELKTAL